MDIEEMKRKKTQLEGEIANLLNDFEIETKVKVSDISFHRAEIIGHTDFGYIYSVGLEVRL